MQTTFRPISMSYGRQKMQMAMVSLIRLKLKSFWMSFLHSWMRVELKTTTRTSLRSFFLNLMRITMDFCQRVKWPCLSRGSSKSLNLLKKQSKPRAKEWIKRNWLTSLETTPRISQLMLMSFMRKSMMIKMACSIKRSAGISSMSSKR